MFIATLYVPFSKSRRDFMCIYKVFTYNPFRIGKFYLFRSINIKSLQDFWNVRVYTLICVA